MIKTTLNQPIPAGLTNNREDSKLAPITRPSLNKVILSDVRRLGRRVRMSRLGLPDMLQLQVIHLHLFPLTIGSEGRDPKLYSERKTRSVA